MTSTTGIDFEALAREVLAAFVSAIGGARAEMTPLAERLYLAPMRDALQASLGAKASDAPQPSRGRADVHTTRMSRAEFEKLPEYSMSRPTGVTLGKRWRVNVTAAYNGRYTTLAPHWVLCEYFDIDHPTQCGIRYRDVTIVEPSDSAASIEGEKPEDCLRPLSGGGICFSPAGHAGECEGF